MSQVYLEKIAHSEWSYVALAMACYKLASPLRYTATVGASTLTIKYLKVRLTKIRMVFQLFIVNLIMVSGISESSFCNKIF